MSAFDFFFATRAPAGPLCSERIVYAYTGSANDLGAAYMRAYGSSRGRESQLLLHDVVTAQRDNEEDAKEGAGRRQRDEFAEVVRGIF